MFFDYTQDFIVQHNQQGVIELDANLPPKQLLKVCVVNVYFIVDLDFTVNDAV